MQVGVGLAASPRGPQLRVGRRRGGVPGQVPAVRAVRVGGGGDRAPGRPDLLIRKIRAGRQAERLERVHVHRVAPGPKTSSRLAGGSGQVVGAGSRRGSGTRAAGSGAAGGGSSVSGEGLGRATWTKVAAPRWM